MKTIKTIADVFDALTDAYNESMHKTFLKDDEKPSEDVCGNCKGCGNFTDSDGVERDCIIDYDAGECYYIFTDYENFGLLAEEILNGGYECEISGLPPELEDFPL